MGGGGGGNSTWHSSSALLKSSLGRRRGNWNFALKSHAWLLLNEVSAAFGEHRACTCEHHKLHFRR